MTPASSADRRPHNSPLGAPRERNPIPPRPRASERARESHGEPSSRRSPRREPFLPLLVGSASRLALRLAYGGRLADVPAFLDLYFVVLVLSLRWFRLSPPGSAARRWARFAIWAATSSITLVVAWSLVGPPTFEALIWGTAAIGVLVSLYLLIFY